MWTFVLFTGLYPEIPEASQLDFSSLKEEVPLIHSFLYHLCVNVRAGTLTRIISYTKIVALKKNLLILIALIFEPRNVSHLMSFRRSHYTGTPTNVYDVRRQRRHAR